VSVAGPESEGQSLAGKPLAGSPEEMADGLRGFEEAGIAHAICEMSPTNAESLDRLAEGLAVYRG
jgi:alkanesulfonate monooxygenase SsuD/methylene tetrahydromethanopterin reductase-like flavin-dependent oxidoreductase (luciferase family)